MTKSMRLFLLALPLAVCPAQAQDSARPLVRVEINPETVTVGQAATLRVTVLVPTWFTKPPVFPSFELPNTVTRLPPDSSFSTNQRFGRETWSGIVRDYLVYPQVSARFELTGGIVRVTYADPETRRPVTEDVAVPPVTYAGTIPAGAASLDPFLPAAALTLEQSLEGGSGQLTAGDAMIRTVTARVEGLPSLFLPRLVHDPNAEGITAYPKEPVTEDVQAGRGRGFEGRRTETGLPAALHPDIAAAGPVYPIHTPSA